MADNSKKYSKKNSTKHAKVSEETQEEAMKIAKGTQKPGQTKEQTKLVAQGIQKGIDLYKKQHKAKTRDLNKQLKTLAKAKDKTDEPEVLEVMVTKQHWLPWSLLVASWCAFVLYLYL